MDLATVSYQQLQESLQILLEQGPPAHVYAALAHSRAPRGAQQFPLPRIMLGLKGRHHVRYSVQQRSRSSELQVGDALFTAPMAWTKARHAPHARFFALVCHHGFTRYLVFDTNSRGTAIAAQKYWVHTRQDTSAPLRQSLLALTTACSRHVDSSDPVMSHLLYSSLLLAAEELQQQEQDAPDHVQRQWREACAWIDEHCQRELSRDELADMLQVHPNHIARIFKHCNDHFPTRLEHARLNRSTALLTQSTASIHEIASRCGFQSSSYFIRRFKRRHGLTPAQFRRQQQQTGS